jgi:hypothetical protein
LKWRWRKSGKKRYLHEARRLHKESEVLSKDDIALIEEFMDVDPFDEGIDFEIELEDGEVFDCTFLPDWEEGK